MAYASRTIFSERRIGHEAARLRAGAMKERSAMEALNKEAEGTAR